MRFKKAGKDMFCLNNNIYIVNGKRRACIYDLNHSDLYSIPLELASVLQDISSYGELPDSLLKTSTFQTLLQQGILVRAEEEKLPLISCSAPKIELATFEITQKCNFRCIHCFEKDKSYKDVPLETARIVIDELVSEGISNIHLFGGEPFAHPYFCEILEYCKGKFRKIHITTNASLLDKRILASLTDPQIMVLASLHSDLPQSFDRVTGTKNQLAVVQNNISLMKEAGVNVQVRKVKITGIWSTDHYENYHGDMSGYPIMIGNANIHQYSRDMLRTKAVTESCFTTKLDVENVLRNMEYQACFSKNIYIDVNLDVYPCIMERRKKHGTLGRKPLKDVISDSIRGVTKDEIERCRDCEYRYACNTCFVDTRSDFFYACPWFCLYEPEKGTWKDVDSWIDEVLDS